MHNKKQFAIYGKTESFYAIGFIITTILISIIMFSLSFLGVHFLVFGIIFFAMWLIVIIVFARKPFYVKINDEDIQVKTLFGKVKKVNNISNLKEISINKIISMKSLGGDYICFKFSDKTVKWENLNELIEDDEIILIRFSSQIKSVIDNLIELPIIDNRAE